RGIAFPAREGFPVEDGLESGLVSGDGLGTIALLRHVGRRLQAMAGECDGRTDEESGSKNRPYDLHLSSFIRLPGQGRRSADLQVRPARSRPEGPRSVWLKPDNRSLNILGPPH